MIKKIVTLWFLDSAKEKKMITKIIFLQLNIIEKCLKKILRKRQGKKLKKNSSLFFLEMWKKFDINDYLTI